VVISTELLVMLLLLSVFVLAWLVIAIDAAERTYWDDQDEHKDAWKDRNV
jgi:hypothetical protein